MGRYEATDFGYGFAVQEEETLALVNTSGLEADGDKTTASKSNNNNDEEIELVKAPTKETETEKSEGVTSPAAATDGYKLYEDKEERAKDAKEQDVVDDYKYEPPKGYRGGESFVVADDASGGGTTVNGIACLGAICCCITVALVIAGGILICYEQYKDSKSFLLVGTILIVLAVGACLCGCCSLCLGMVADGFSIGGGGSGGGGGGRCFVMGGMAVERRRR